jgi:hypothetical protein
MSEYQYYEFSTLDGPLSMEQRTELRSRSTRAEITATSFINEYHWGSLKAEPFDWMVRHFDAHVYSANWGQCHFMLALPSDALDRATALNFAGGRNAEGGYGGTAFDITGVEDRWILTWRFDAEDGGDERFCSDDGPGWMERLQAMRDELLSGDLRPLYLGWMARLCACELDDDAPEPSPPAGLRALTAAQSALAEFLTLDPDLLTVAAAASADLVARRGSDGGAARWVEQLSLAELREAMLLLANGAGREAERRARRRFATWRSHHEKASGPIPPLRSAAQIEAARGEAGRARQELERRQRELLALRQADERRRHDDMVAARAETIWTDIDAMLQRGTGTAYESAERALVELAEALTAQGRGADFQRGLSRQLATHGKRPAWLMRLRRRGLM